jgi:hypothetical protein
MAQELDLNGRIFAAMVGGFTGLAIAQVSGMDKHTLPAVGVGALVGAVALPKIFPTAYYGAKAAGVNEDDE